MPAKDSTLIIQRLRALMSNLDVVPRHLDAYIIPSADAHYSEYIADCDNRRAFITGFTGSAGTAIVTKDKALLWTDGRYYIQAANQIDTNWTLMKLGLPQTPTQAAWLSKNMANGSAVGVDPTLYTQDEWESLSKELRFAGKTLTAVAQNLVDLVWTDRPPRPENGVIELGVEFSGKSTKDKLEEVRKELADAGCESLLVTELDEIAWLLNLRGSDISYNPVFFAFVLLSMTGVEIFINPNKLTNEIRKNLKTQAGDVVFHPYEHAFDRFQEHVMNSTGRVFVSKRCSHSFVDVIPEERRTMKLTPISLMKSLKNHVEIQGMENAHIRDAAALCQFFSWLENEMLAGSKVTEISAADKLQQCRAKQRHFMGLSFPSISSSGPNGAIIHYNPDSSSNRTLSTNEMYLIDSGGQYCDGTTDVTRTLHFGNPSEFQMEAFTRVLKGTIALKNAVFPNKVVGNSLDTLARRSLWEVGLDYIHGTGHGIGHFLNVHEGPQGISYRHLPDDPGLQENMFLSNEPGYYHEGEFGVRIENIIRIISAKGLPNNFANRGYLTFEDVTFVPIQQKLIKIDLLTSAEVNYINEYHAKCRQKVGSYMKENGLDEGGFQWLLKETEALRPR